ncbi:MAG TPA: hypothetical protein VG502_16340 [Flexivirga sp.]|uniref:hypothetical protein n=1 Tax=Flexivirga sp. TaxID=1962927 RepID=UPI002C9C39C7|nr:hypothetical protein [Flexivirga sp.]HWC23866.1 hypothetical protein [Flexivirga sp.]
MADRPVIEVPTPAGGWHAPWPNVAEIEAAFPHQKWTLVGGLMSQLHAIRHGLDAVRPTSDVDIALHIETTPGVAASSARAFEMLGYELAPSLGRHQVAHRFVRDAATIDVVVADHAAPRARQKLRGHPMVAIDGGTQALKRTVIARLDIVRGRTTTLSVPSAFGAVVLKSAAYKADSRDKRRHLADAAVLLSVIEDPYAERATLAGSDRSRLLTLRRALPDDAAEWRVLSADRQVSGKTALRILTADL